MALLIDYNFKKNLDTSAKATLAILAYNLAPAVSFGDSDGAKQLLDSFKTSKDVVSASVYALDGDGGLELLANYATQENFQLELDVQVTEKAFFDGAHYQNTIPIKVEEEVIGYLHQYSIFAQLSNFQLQMFGIISITLLLCLSLGVGLSLKFQPMLLEPLSSLVKVTKTIRQQKDYSLRVNETGKDEFAMLSKSFNHMLEEIEKHLQAQLSVEEEIRELNLNLESKVTQRTEELANTNNDLQKTLDALENSHKQLVEQEKMASLGSLVAGVAHEINTPIGVGVTAVSHLNEAVIDITQKMEEKRLTQSGLTEFLSIAKKGAEISLFNLTRAAEIITNFKLIAVDQSSDQFRTISLNSYLHEVVRSLHPKLKKLKHKVTIECDESLFVHCRPGALVQVMTNLLMNSIVHGFEHIDEGSVLITANTIGSKVHIRYQDDGKGMSQKSLAKLFEPFFTTKRGEGGSGLGAHLVYILVTQGLKGEISVASEINEGLTYDFTFPLSAEEDASDSTD